MERFVRGDESRNTEGSGLGISIAKSLMELMGGSFMLYVDGDLFKVVLGFAQMEEEKEPLDDIGATMAYESEKSRLDKKLEKQREKDLFSEQ